MTLRVVFLLLALVGCCVNAQDAQATALSQGRGQGNQNQQNSNCLARCMNQGIQASQRVVNNEFRNTCGTYRGVANCLDSCGRGQWDDVAEDMIDYCNQEDRRSDRFNSCYNRWLDPTYDQCLRQCSRGSKSWMSSSNFGSYCQTLHCFMPCMINRLNDRCNNQAGYALGNLYYTPYVVMYESRFLYPWYVQALRQIPNQCGLFYVGNYLRSGDGNEDINQFAFMFPNANDTAH
ncbi:hypothetical protein M3Y97_00869700 [Aphelenchoides bicaudatus]|nr:hypothetical protein M3Y97_00869700 [Aphelenchoides bicaudatus]